MGSGASSVEKAKGADAGAITAGVGDLNAVDKSILLAALEARTGGDAIATNLKNITENEAKIHELYLSVMTNKQGVFESRSMIEENRANIMKDYAGAFTGNRQMANENTDAIFKNRNAIFDALKVDGPVQENFKNSKYNETNTEYLNNRCLLNNRVAKTSAKMSEANADLIAVNDLILKSNEEIVQFNAAQIETNKKLLTGVQADKATPEANAARIASNSEKIANIKERNDKYNAAMGDKHAAIKANRAVHKEQKDAIKARRKLILANREAILANGTKVAEALRGGAVNVEDVAKSVAALSDEECANLKAALLGGGDGGEVVAANRKQITENEANLHALHLEVLGNKASLYSVRAAIEENRSLILKNYAAAFVGSRQMANQNTDDIFKNRVGILDALKVDGQVQENFRNTKYNEANIDFLEHRSLLNNRVAKANEMMSAVNAKLIEINGLILGSNEEIVKFNTEAIDTNGKLLTGIQADKATPEANKARIEKNSAMCKTIGDHTAKYAEKAEAQLALAMENRKKAIANAKDIDERRVKILANRKDINENGQKVVEQLKM